MAIKRHLLLLSLMLFLAGCGGPKDIRAQRQVSMNEVVGIWQLRQDCLDWLAKSGRFTPSPNSNFQIELRSDGTCRYQSILQYPTIYVDCEGTWKLQISKDGRSEVDLSLKRNGSYGLHLDFTELYNQLEIWEYWGDPDTCEILRYDKRK